MTPIGGVNWMGGRNYQLNLLRAVSEYAPDRIRPVVFCGDDLSDPEVEQFSAIEGVEVIRSSVFGSRSTASRLLRAVTLGLDTATTESFARHQVAVVFESAAYYGWRNPFPTIAWFPDLQHRRMPELFGFRAYWRRELGFRAQVASGRRLMLSSENARADCERYYPGTVGRTDVVRFAAPIEPALFVDDPWAAVSHYRLPSNFVFLPNQFWRHKNHGIVIEAVARLRDMGVDLTVVASGNTVDPRHPDHFAGLLARIESLRLGERFRILGMIPRRDLVSLMRTCRALVNPSFFEGWSSTVEEARTLGVPMLLSDISVHHEQMGDAARYFGVDDVLGLAEHLEFVSKNCPAPQMARESRADAKQDVRRFAADFAAVVELAASNWRGPAPDSVR